MDQWGFLESRRYSIHDRDTKFTKSFDAVFESAGVHIKQVAFRSPNTNAFVERFIQTLQVQRPAPPTQDEAADQHDRRRRKYDDQEAEIHPFSSP